MTKLCFREEDVESVLRAEDDSVEKRHAMECPRCRALLDSYAEFASAPSSREASFLAEADLAAARGALRAFTREHLPPVEEAHTRRAAPEATSSEVPGRASLPARRAPESGLSRFLKNLRSPLGLGLAGAFAALVVALAMFRPAEDQTRGHGTPGTETHLSVQPARAVSGGVEFEWSAWEGATGYDLLLLDRSLSIKKRLDAGIETHYVLAGFVREEAGNVTYWQIEARGPAGKLASSRLEELPRR